MLYIVVLTVAVMSIANGVTAMVDIASDLHQRGVFARLVERLGRAAPARIRLAEQA